MNKINENFASLTGGYLFSEIARRVAAYKEDNPGAQVISMGIGDVSQPLTPAVTQALHLAVDEMGQAATFRGYGPYPGYDFLRQAIVSHEFAPRSVNISPDEIFVSDGAKCDVGNFQELFAEDAKVALTDPVYPVYVDSNVMAGRAGVWNGSAWSRLIYLPCVAEHNFVPQLPAERPDLIYLCYPNNPTGSVLTREQLKTWVDYARANESVILFDAAYESFITDPDIPHSIFEIEGAREVAVEFRSYSKKAGFTGLRCAYTVIPDSLVVRSQSGVFKLNELWLRRQGTKYNGCPYIVQRAAEAVYSPQARQELALVLNIYQKNATLIRSSLEAMGLACVGGDNSPYVWAATPNQMKSWDFFDLLLRQAQIVCTPGVGFGPSGEGYARFTAFASPENTKEAMLRIKSVF